MVGLLEANQALSSIKTLSDIGKALLGLRDGKLTQEMAIECNRVLLAAQDREFNTNAEKAALIEEKRALEKELLDMKTWNTEKEKYELKVFQSGARAYIPKEEAHLPKQSHEICANCYHNGNKSILQGITRNPGRDYVLECHKCGSDLYIDGAWRPEHDSRRKSLKR